MSENNDLKHQNENIEESFDLLTDIQHVLIRPTVYVGSVLPETFTDYIYTHYDGIHDDEEIPNFQQNQPLVYSVGIITLINEILNNSYDEYIRTLPLAQSKRLTKIDVTINRKTGCLTVTDNGGIPVKVHEKHKMLLPTMLFGHLRSGSNYGKNRGKVSGTNGVGASLVNVFSKRFEIITNDTQKTFHGVWQDNMSKMPFENVKVEKKTKGYTTVSAYIDFHRFGMEGFTNDLVSKIETRCVELASMGADKTKPLTITLTVLNGEKNLRDTKETFKFNDFSEYVSLFNLGDEFGGFGNENMSFVVGASGSDSTESISILNSIRCDFGTHIDALSDMVINHIRVFMEKKHKIVLRPKQIKDRLKFISRWSINEPSFSAQIKDKLTTEVKDFGFKIESNTKFNAWLEKSEIVNKLIDFYQNKKNEEDAESLRRAQNKKVKTTHIEKLIDASSKNRKNCMIFVAEGDSAMNGVRTTRDAETQGAFCVGGKFTNIYGKKPSEILKVKGKVNVDSKAKNLIDALGLTIGGDISSLRWGKIVIMTDADYDGYCIACQLIYFLRHYWKELFDKGMVYRVLSPIMVSRKGTDVKVYYTMEEYEKERVWLERNKYKSKHIKGLASLRPEEYADVIQKPVLQQIVCDDEDMKTMEVWFGDDADIRKEYINTEFDYA